jgi:hypothetical protein
MRLKGERHSERMGVEIILSAWQQVVSEVVRTDQVNHGGSCGWAGAGQPQTRNPWRDAGNMLSPCPQLKSGTADGLAQRLCKNKRTGLIIAVKMTRFS